MISAEEMRAHCSECQRTYRDEMVYGKRCNETVEVHYDPKDKIFHREKTQTRMACSFIQNTKKGFYVIVKDVVTEYFYDSYEGWYIRSYHSGFKYNYPCEAANKYKQCDWALKMNSHNFAQVVK